MKFGGKFTSVEVVLITILGKRIDEHYVFAKYLTELDF